MARVTASGSPIGGGLFQVAIPTGATDIQITTSGSSGYDGGSVGSVPGGVGGNPKIGTFRFVSDGARTLTINFGTGSPETRGMFGSGGSTPGATATLRGFYRFYSDSLGLHFYTHNPGNEYIGDNGYVLENEGNIYFYLTLENDSSILGTVPLYRFYNTSTGDHLFGLNQTEVPNNGSPWNLEGVVGYVWPPNAPGPNTVPVYRKYNGLDHLLTTDRNEGSGSYALDVDPLFYAVTNSAYTIYPTGSGAAGGYGGRSLTVIDGKTGNFVIVAGGGGGGGGANSLGNAGAPGKNVGSYVSSIINFGGTGGTGISNNTGGGGGGGGGFVIAGFSANVVNGSTTITNTITPNGSAALIPGMVVTSITTGLSVPPQTKVISVSSNNSTVVLSNPVVGSPTSAQFVAAESRQFIATTVNGSNTITNLSSVSYSQIGLSPGDLVNTDAIGLSVPVGTTIISITNTTAVLSNPVTGSSANAIFYGATIGYGGGVRGGGGAGSSRYRSAEVTLLSEIQGTLTGSSGFTVTYEPAATVTTPTYTLTLSATSVNEGSGFTATVTTTNVATGTTIYYGLSGTGITASDFTSGALTGSGTTDSNGSFTFTPTLANDQTTEGAETLSVKLYSDAARTIQVATTKTITINDTSTTTSPPGAPTVTLTLPIGVTSITAGGSTTLTWFTTGDVTSITWSPSAPEGNPNYSGSGVVNPTVTTTYTVTVSGPGGTATATKMLTVNPATPAPVIVSFTASPTSITSGSSSTLSWSYSGNVTSVSINQGVGDVTSLTSKSVNPTTTTTYTLTVTGPGGTVTSPATVTVTAPPPPPRPTVSLELPPGVTSITAGSSTTLTWSTTGSITSISWSPSAPNGNPNVSGSESVNPTSTTIYIVTVSGPGGTATATKTLTVNQIPIVTLSPPPPEPSVLAYNTQGRIDYTAEHCNTSLSITPTYTYSTGPVVGTAINITPSTSRITGFITTVIPYTTAGPSSVSYRIAGFGSGGNAAVSKSITITIDDEPDFFVIPSRLQLTPSQADVITPDPLGVPPIPVLTITGVDIPVEITANAPIQVSINGGAWLNIRQSP